MNKNKHLTIEIEDHRNPNPYSSGRPSYYAAKNIADTLIKKGIHPNRLTSKGYGATQPLISDLTIKKARTKEEKEALLAKNRRTVLKIKAVDFGQ
jgi:outer membrane protein OmpA-like peptidoglycan-associated protein